MPPIGRRIRSDRRKVAGPTGLVLRSADCPWIRAVDQGRAESLRDRVWPVVCLWESTEHPPRANSRRRTQQPRLRNASPQLRASARKIYHRDTENTENSKAWNSLLPRVAAVEAYFLVSFSASLIRVSMAESIFLSPGLPSQR